MPGAYDGDGKADFAIYRSGGWYILRSSDGGVSGVELGEDWRKTYRWPKAMDGAWCRIGKVAKGFTDNVDIALRVYS